jgi:hypothetical protein
VAKAIRPVVSNGRPLVFEWVGSGSAEPVAVTWSGEGAPTADTLRFDGSGRAIVWLPPGSYRYRLAAGGAGTVAVEQYSDEFRPRSVTLHAHSSRASASPGRQSARDLLWLFALCVAALAGEWLARRRLGLR